MIHFLLLILLPCCVTPLSADESELQLTLPPAIFVVSGEQTSIYFDNVVLTQSPEDYRFEVTCDVPHLADQRRWTFTPTDDDTGEHPLNVTVYTADNKLLESKSCVLKVITVDAPQSPKSIQLLIIGDSLTHASAYPNEIGRLLSQDDHPKWKMLGTHKPSSAAKGVAHEGYGGWTWSRFVTQYEPNPDGTHRKRSSPFVFLNEDSKPQLDMPRYFAESCEDQRPDYVVIMLGINDCFSAPPDDIAGMDDRIDTMFNYADQLLAAIKDAAPNAQIGICLTTPPNARQAAFQANYKDRYTRWGWKRIQHRLVQRQIQYVDAKADPNISIVPTHLNLDPTDGYPANNGVHPNDVGYKQVGASVYSWLKWRFSNAHNPSPISTTTESEKAFLLPYFLGNGETGIYFAYSDDGLKFKRINEGKVLLPAPNWTNNLTRDPSIIFHDGVFHMVWTTSWKSRTIGYAFSRDLIYWSTPKQINLWGDRTGVRNTWAPELTWDAEKNEFLVLWSSTTLEELNDGDKSADVHGNDHRTYASRTKDFQTWSPPKLFFSPDPEHTVIDPFVARDDRGTKATTDDRWVMVIKNEMSVENGGKNLRLTFSSQMQGPYDRKLGPPIVGAGTEIVNQMAEGPSLFKRDSIWYLYWDAPGSEFSYCLATSPDLKKWTNRSAEMSLPEKRMRHGTVLLVPRNTIGHAVRNDAK